MYKLGVATMNGDMGLPKNPKDAVKWHNRSVEAATPDYPEAIHELANLHVNGIPNVIFVDLSYAVSLYNEAADMNYAPSAFKLGECYEYGKLNCQPDPALSIHYYAIAAEKGDRDACFALTAWYLVGSPNALPQSDENAYLWAKRAADMSLPKAEYAVGYFTETGIGCEKNPAEALKWYQKAANNGDKRAMQRLQQRSKAQEQLPKDGKKKRSASDDCTIM
jgi:TPR repeat protein